MPQVATSPVSGLSFDNTEIAFKAKTNRDLQRSYFLFSAISYNWLVKAGPSMVNFAFSIRLPIKGLVKATIFKQFCGGESMDECDTVMDKLYSYGVGSILDYSVEGKEEEADFNHTAEETIKTIRKAANNPKIPFCVFKVTGLARFALLEKINTKEQLSSAEQAEFDRVASRIEKICKTAHDLDVRIFFDAEESWIQDAIDGMAREMMLRFNAQKAIVYNTIQFYRHDKLAFLKECYEDALKYGYVLGIKLVRGAYMEKERARAEEKGYPSPIQKDKQATDNDYNEALKFCINHIERIHICAGTHNENSSMLLVQLMLEKGIAHNDSRVYFSQLYGMSDHISFNLSDKGYHVAKYLPYGPVKAVLPYLFRRAQENTSVKGQSGRELMLVSREIARRKASR